MKFHVTRGILKSYLFAGNIAHIIFIYVKVNRTGRLQPSGCNWSLLWHFVLLKLVVNKYKLNEYIINIYYTNKYTINNIQTYIYYHIIIILYILYYYNIILSYYTIL